LNLTPPKLRFVSPPLTKGRGVREGVLGKE
jgi:hypothetical protein